MHIETQRLSVSLFTADMAEAVHRNSLDEDTRRFTPDEVFETVEEAAETIEFLMSCYESGEGPLVYPIILSNGSNVGYVQAVPMEDGLWEIGYHVGKTYTGNGYATEAVRAFLPVILEKLKLSSMLGVCLLENAASIKVLQRCGFRKVFEGIGPYQGENLPICKYIYEKE